MRTADDGTDEKQENQIMDRPLLQSVARREVTVQEMKELQGRGRKKKE